MAYTDSYTGPDLSRPVAGQPGNYYTSSGGVFQSGLPATTQAWQQQFANPAAVQPPEPTDTTTDTGTGKKKIAKKMPDGVTRYFDTQEQADAAYNAQMTAMRTEQASSQPATTTTAATPAPAPVIPASPAQQLAGGTATPITPTTTVNPATTGGVGNAATATGDNATSLPAGGSWQDILKFLTNFGLNRSLGSNNLIDLATQQLTNAQGRTNAIDAQQKSVTDFINSMIQQANTSTTTRDQIVQGILNNTGLQAGGGTGPTVLQNAGTLLNQMLSSSTGGGPGTYAAPGSGQPTFDPTGYRNTQLNSFINLAGQPPPGMTDESKAALRLNQSELIPQQFNDALQQARAQLQTQGALGGEQPGSQADMMRTLAPIYAARGTAYSQLNANNILQNEMLKQQQLQQQRQLGLSALGQGVSLDQMTLQNLLSNRGLANQLISALGGITGNLAGVYNPTQSNALAQGGIGDLINLINSGTGALQTGNQAVNAATGAYAAGNQPYSTATGAGETLAQQSPSSFTSLLLNALLSTAANNVGGIAKAVGGIDWGKIFNKVGDVVTNKTGSESTGDVGLPSDWPTTTNPADAFNMGYLSDPGRQSMDTATVKYRM